MPSVALKKPEFDSGAAPTGRGSQRTAEPSQRDNDQMSNPMRGDDTVEDDTLAPGWIEKVSSSHNKIYYYNTSTGESAWEKPLA